MFHKNLHLAGFAGLVALTTLCVSPVKAESQDALLISQLSGHETYRKEPQMNATDYVVGRVRGASGGIMSVELLSPVTVDGQPIMNTTFSEGATQQITGDGMPGEDVIFQVVDNKLVYVGRAHPTWITRLKLKSTVVTTTNTSELLQETNQNRSVGLPPLAPETRTYTEVAPQAAPMTTPAVSPVRGLW